MARPFDASRFLENLTGSYAAPYTAALHDLLVATISGNRPAARDARTRFARLTAETMGVAEVLGARHILASAAGVVGKHTDAELATGGRFSASRVTDEMASLVAFSTQSIIPRVTLTEALEDMVERVPVTIRRGAERTAQKIAELYTEGHVVAFVNAAEASVTKKAQDFIASALRSGMPAGEAGRALAMSVNEIRKRSIEWTEGYARQVFRTNVNTAVTAGRFRQVQDPDIRAVIPAFRFDSVGDIDTRHNHDAADGMILRVDNVAWNRLATPLGYNCRCQVSLVTVVDLELSGRLDADGGVIESKVPSGAGPDTGFRHTGRPDLFFVGGGRF